MDEPRERAHELANELAALRLWLTELRRQPTCAGCATRQSESLAKLTSLVDGAVKKCIELQAALKRPARRGAPRGG